MRDVSEPNSGRPRGTEGNRGSVEPRMDVFGNPDLWQDLRCYLNPIFVNVR